MRKFAVCLAVALLVAGCNDDGGGGGSPTDPSQVNVEFATTDLVVGTGAEAVPGRTVTMAFELWLYDPAGTASKGTRVQGSSDPGIGPFSFVVGGGGVIPGFDQGVRGMRVGGKRRMYIPPSLAYGSAGGGGGRIPPNASIVFEVELTNVQ